MALDYQALVYAPVYRAFGVPGTLTGTGGAQFAVTVLDRTAGLPLAEGGVAAQSEGPAAAVRAPELASSGVDPLGLDGMVLAMNGGTWLVTSHRPLPSPMGEADGEYMLLLEDVSNVVVTPGGGVVVISGYRITTNANGDLIIIAPDGSTTPLVVKT